MKHILRDIKWLIDDARKNPDSFWDWVFIFCITLALLIGLGEAIYEMWVMSWSVFGK